MAEAFPIETRPIKVFAGEDKVIYYPEVIGLSDQTWQATVNNMIATQTQELIDQQVAGDLSTVQTLLGNYELKNNQRNILSLTQTNYVYRYQAAHGMTVVKSLTFDMAKQRAYTLHELFKEGSDYIARLSALVAERIKERDIYVLEPFSAISPDQEFYIADKTLVLYYQLYELAPYVYGIVYFPISIYEISDIIDEDGPLALMM